jgi:cytochrome c peroxidase
MRSAPVAAFLAASLAGLGIGACGEASAPADAALPAPAAPAVTTAGVAAPADVRSAAARLGERIFHDPALSASGRMSCATCHDPAHAFAGADGLAAPLGGAALATPGMRNAASLMYSAFTPPFHFDEEGTPVGGFDRDGRAPSFAAQARDPLLMPFEMGNASEGDVVAKMRGRSYAAEFRAVFGADAFDDEARAFRNALVAVEAFLREDSATFAPFSSKYDRHLEGRVALTEQEQRGLRLFEDPEKGNCAACHPSTREEDGAPPLFTDFTYDNIGVPRNFEIAANGDPAHYDLGLCGPLRTDLAERQDLCGAFKVPTLRNVALTAPYMHNGAFETLREVVEFYVRRDTNPEEFYPRAADGTVRKFDDVPPEHAANVNADEVPYDREMGEAPALTAEEIEDVVAFLETLTDGYEGTGVSIAAGRRSREGR